MGEFSYSLSSGPSDPRADIFQSPFPAQQDMREGWESASSILTSLRKNADLIPVFLSIVNSGGIHLIRYILETCLLIFLRVSFLQAKF